MIVKAKNIHKSFGNLEVLKGVDFEADKGEIVSIVGASGAGKSTLLQILGTLSTPDSGSLEIDGRPVFSEFQPSGKDGRPVFSEFQPSRKDGRPVKGMKSDELAAFRGSRIGFVFQAHHLLPEFTALENVMIPALIAGVPKQEAKTRATELLAKVGLSERTAHKPSELSGGEQQRVSIARALINTPAVLFADEPTGNLDSATKQEIHKLFFKLRDDLGQTIVIVTHDSALAALCDRTLTMQDGRFID